MEREEIYRQFFETMERVANSQGWPETKEEALHDEVRKTRMRLEEHDKGVSYESGFHFNEADKAPGIEDEGGFGLSSY